MSVQHSERCSTNWKSPRFGLRRLLLVVMLCGVLFTLVHFVLRTVTVVERTSGINKFKTVLFALRYYDDVYGYLPAAFTTDADGQPACSWRFVTMPYWEWGSVNTLPRTDRPWNASANAPWVSLEIDIFCFSANSLRTNVAAVTGRGTAFDLGHQCRLEELPNDIILIIEMRDFGVHWMQPGDLEIGDLPPCSSSTDTARSLFGTTEDHFVVGFADSEVWALSKSLPLDDLKKFFTIEGAKQFDRDVVLRPYRLRSW